MDHRSESFFPLEKHINIVRSISNMYYISEFVQIISYLSFLLDIVSPTDKITRFRTSTILSIGVRRFCRKHPISLSPEEARRKDNQLQFYNLSKQAQPWHTSCSNSRRGHRGPESYPLRRLPPNRIVLSHYGANRHLSFYSYILQRAFLYYIL